MGDDGSVVVAGQTDGDWDIPNLGHGDMAAFKLDVDGTLLWRWQVLYSLWPKKSCTALNRYPSATRSGTKM